MQMRTDEYVKLNAVENQMWYFRALHRRMHGHLHRHLRGVVRPGVLDAGCGTGGLIEHLRAWEPGWQFTGVDLSEVACGFAQKRCPFAEFAQGSVTALPFADNTFDAVLSSDVLCQLEAPQACLHESFRCLKPGGIVVVNAPAYRWLWSYHDEACQSKNRYLRREIDQYLHVAGFHRCSSTYWNTLPFPLVVLKRKLLPAAPGSSDIRLLPRPLETLFNATMALEHGWTEHVSALPYGSSILAVGVKPA